MIRFDAWQHGDADGPDFSRGETVLVTAARLETPQGVVNGFAHLFIPEGWAWWPPLYRASVDEFGGMAANRVAEAYLPEGL